MVDRRIEFVWDAGGGMMRITHPLKLLTNTQDVWDSTKWYYLSPFNLTFKFQKCIDAPFSVFPAKIFNEGD